MSGRFKLDENWLAEFERLMGRKVTQEELERWNAYMEVKEVQVINSGSSNDELTTGLAEDLGKMVHHEPMEQAFERLMGRPMTQADKDRYERFKEEQDGRVIKHPFVHVDVASGPDVSVAVAIEHKEGLPMQITEIRPIPSLDTQMPGGVSRRYEEIKQRAVFDEAQYVQGLPAVAKEHIESKWQAVPPEMEGRLPYKRLEAPKVVEYPQWDAMPSREERESRRWTRAQGEVVRKARFPECALVVNCNGETLESSSQCGEGLRYLVRCMWLTLETGCAQGKRVVVYVFNAGAETEALVWEYIPAYAGEGGWGELVCHLDFPGLEIRNVYTSLSNRADFIHALRSIISGLMRPVTKDLQGWRVVPPPQMPNALHAFLTTLEAAWQTEISRRAHF